MEKEIKHSELPWNNDYYRTCIMTENKQGEDVYIGSLKLPNNNINTPQGIHCIPSQTTQEANAEFIVTACNNFYPLIEALEGNDALLTSLSIWLELGLDDVTMLKTSKTILDDINKQLKKIQQALAQAKGGK